MKNIKKQQGLSFISWLVVAAMFIFVVVTVSKLIPSYIKYDAVKGIIDTIAQDPENKMLNKRAIMAKIDKHIDISSIYDLSSKQFKLEKVRNRKKVRELSVSYEDRVNWFANLDIVVVFNYSAIIGDE